MRVSLGFLRGLDREFEGFWKGRVEIEGGVGENVVGNGII